MIVPICDKCRSNLMSFGALVFSPPFIQEFLVDNEVRYKQQTEKYHICSVCWLKLLEWIETK